MGKLSWDAKVWAGDVGRSTSCVPTGIRCDSSSACAKYSSPVPSDFFRIAEIRDSFRYACGVA